MKISKAILYTLLFIVVIFTINFLTSYYRINFHIEIDPSLFFAGIIELIFVLCFTYAIFKNNILSLPQKTSRIWYFWSIVFGIVYVLIQPIILWIYYLILDVDYIIAYGFFDKLNFSILHISSIILLPISEELYFRQFIQNRLQNYYRPVTAILVTSILFSIIHAPLDAYLINLFDLSLDVPIVPNWKTTYLTFWGSLILGVLYYKSKSIGPAIVMHSVWNITILFL